MLEKFRSSFLPPFIGRAEIPVEIGCIELALNHETPLGVPFERSFPPADGSGKVGKVMGGIDKLEHARE